MSLALGPACAERPGMAAEKDAAARFARDFGYLDKFLKGIQEFASTQTGERGERLQALLAGEPERWGEVRALLEGKAVSASSSQSSEAPKPASQPAGESYASSDPAPTAASKPAGAEATVGRSLRDRRETSHQDDASRVSEAGGSSGLTVGRLLVDRRSS